jgi:hypothetical protein
MQVDMHDIDAEIAGADFSDQRVEIRAVAIKITARLMQQVSNLDDIAFRTGRRCWGWSPSCPQRLCHRPSASLNASSVTRPVPLSSE